MKLEFRLKSGKLIGTIQPVYAIVMLSALSGAVLAFLSDFENLTQYCKDLIILLTGEKDRSVRSWLADTFKFFGLLAAGVLFLVIWGNILTGFFILCRDFIVRKACIHRRLLRKKIEKEISSYVELSFDDLYARSNKAEKDAKDLREAVKSKLIDNEKVWEFNPPKIDVLNDKKLKRFLDTPNLDDLEKSIKQLSFKIIENTDSKKPIIKFFAATVQPSIQLLISNLHTKHNLSGYLKIEKNSKTGPEAVLNARLAHKDKDSTEERILLVAPLAAFCMAPELDSCQEPPKQFTPLFNVITENQDILVVESSSRIPLKKGRFYYYDNSTAEEILAKHGQDIKDLLHITRIEEYSIYLKILKGERTQLGKLEIGDAIATWPPLTDYYNGKSVADGFFCKDAFNFSTEIPSQIFLFVDNRCLEDPNSPSSNLCWMLIQAILLQMKRARYLRHGKVDKQRQFIRDNVKEFRNLTLG